MDAGDQVAQLRSRIAEASANRVREVAIDISKCFQQSLRMPHGQAKVAPHRRRQIVPGGVQGLTGLVYPVHVKVIGIFLLPVEAAFFPIEMKLQVVAIAGCDLGYEQNAWGSVVELEQYVAVIVEGAAGYDVVEIRADFGYFASAYVLEQIECMDADIADRSA